MKLIDVLVKIANGEEVKPFMIDGERLEVKNYRDLLANGVYIVDEDGDPVHWCIYKEWLNEEVEFIDEKKEKKRKKKEEDKFLKALKELIETLEEDE